MTDGRIYEELAQLLWTSQPPKGMSLISNQDDIARVRQRMRRQLVGSLADDSQGLAKTFSKTITAFEALKLVNLDAHWQGFLSSAEFSRCSTVPYVPAVLYTEEAFYDFTVRSLNPLPEIIEELLRHEALMQIYRRTAGGERRGITLRPSWGQRSKGRLETIQTYHFDLQRRQRRTHRYFYGATPGKLLSGEVPS